MNNSNFRKVGSLVTVNDLKPGTIGLMGEYNYDGKDENDILVLACLCEDTKYASFQNKHNAICLTLLRKEDGSIDTSLLGTQNSGEDWVYVPDTKPILMVDPNSRRKSRYSKSGNSRNAIYLSTSGRTYWLSRHGTIDLNQLSLSQKREDYAQMMDVTDWGFYEILNNSTHIFWS